MMYFEKNNSVLIKNTQEKKIISEIELIEGVEILYMVDGTSYSSSQVSMYLDFPNEMLLKNLQEYCKENRAKTIEAVRLWCLELDKLCSKAEKSVKKKKYWFF